MHIVHIVHSFLHIWYILSSMLFCILCIILCILYHAYWAYCAYSGWKNSFLGFSLFITTIARSPTLGPAVCTTTYNHHHYLLIYSRKWICNVYIICMAWRASFPRSRLPASVEFSIKLVCAKYAKYVKYTGHIHFPLLV
jgi:hypothetical protein